MEEFVRQLAGSVIEGQSVFAVMASIAAGTPLGAGYAMNRNQRWLKPCKVVEIQGTGSCASTIVNEADFAGRAAAA